MKNKLILLLLVLVVTLPSFAEYKIYDLVDEKGNKLTQTSLELSTGDVYISEDNREFEVVSVENDQVKVRQTGVVDLSTYLTMPLDIQVGGKKPIIGIYHTHSDESYLPGEASQPYPGEIYEVGKALKESLEAEGFDVKWSQANHNPHDGTAYNRSRDTAAKLLRNNPVTLIDVHRDAIPDPNIYKTDVNGQSAAKVRIVTGKQNQNRTSNFEYAKAIKAHADNNYPGIIEGIFWAKGNYNQDIGPRTILLEFGTHVLTLNDALVSAKKFGAVIAQTLPQGGGRGERLGARSGIFWVLLIGIVGTAIFLLINKNGLEAFKNLGERFTHSLRRRRREKP